MESVSQALHMDYKKSKKKLSEKKCLYTLWKDKAMLKIIREAANIQKPCTLTEIFGKVKTNHMQVTYLTDPILKIFTI